MISVVRGVIKMSNCVKIATEDSTIEKQPGSDTKFCLMKLTFN